MAMTQSGLMIMAGLAALATVGMFRRWADNMTRVVVTALAAVVWTLMGIASFDVIVRDTYAASASAPMYPLAYLGLALGAICGAFTLYQLVMLVGSESGAGANQGVRR